MIEIEAEYYVKEILTNEYCLKSIFESIDSSNSELGVVSSDLIYTLITEGVLIDYLRPGIEWMIEKGFLNNLIQTILKTTNIETEEDKETFTFLLNTLKNFFELPKSILEARETIIHSHLLKLAKIQKDLRIEILKVLSKYYTIVIEERKKFVEEGGLPILGKCLKKTQDVIDLNSLGDLIIQLLMGLEGVWYDWVVFKFKEQKYEKYILLLDLHW